MKTMGQAYRPAKPIEGRFDAIVVGSGMGGMSVASLLAQKSWKVLLLEQHNVVGGLTQSYSRNGYRWTVGLHYIGDVGSSQTTTWRLFDAVTESGIAWAKLPDIYNRMVIAGKAYDIPAGATNYAAALKRYFPNETDAIDRYLHLVQEVTKSSSGYFAEKALPPNQADATYEAMCGKFHGFSDELTIDVLSKLTSDKELIAVLCANWGDYSLEPSKSSFAMHCMLAKHYLNGGSYPTGGGQSFSKAIVPIIERAGGMVLHSAEVTEILVEDGETKGVRLSSGEELACPVVISNAGVQNTYGRLVSRDNLRPTGLLDQLGKVADSYAVVGLNIGFNRPARELGFGSANIWAHPSNDLEANLEAHRTDFSAPFPWTFITFPSTKDPSWDEAHPGKSTVEMYGYTDFRHFEKWRGSRWMKRGDDYLALKENIRERLLDELFRHAPAARSALDCVEVSTPLSYETFVKRERGGFMGIEASPQRFRQRWLRARTPIKGLYLTGQDISTDGIIGALVGGVITASTILGVDMMTEIRKRYVNPHQPQAI
ncbi:NAD(P)/FAD-dependent oxidoreductase [Bradyrhizobium sp. 14AA]